jgi:hypothetical protein
MISWGQFLNDFLWPLLRQMYVRTNNQSVFLFCSVRTSILNANTQFVFLCFAVVEVVVTDRERAILLAVESLVPMYTGVWWEGQ